LKSNRCVLQVLAAAAVLAGCSSSGSGAGGGQGGAAGPSGGAVGSGGAGLGGSGGGGAPSAGGNAAGGASVSGAKAAGGTSGQGGSPMGGATGSGGATIGSQGGASKTGGAGGGNSGGAAGTGGTTGGTGTGGNTSAGGSMATGGATGAGGTTSSPDGGAAGSTGTGTMHWVGTWTASPYPIPSDGEPPAPLSKSVVRQIAHISLGGSQIRVQFSNLSGNGPVVIGAAHVAICKASPAVDSTIDAATDKALAFSGSESVTIAQGKEVWSDPLDFTVANQGNISITTAFTSVPSNLTGHSGSRTTSYQQTNSTTVNAASMSTAQTADHWYYIAGIDVMAPASAIGVVAIGDSITDGRGTDTNHNNRWTDILAARLQANAATANVAMMNQAIGATNLVGNSGTAAQARFDRDVLGQSGVKYVIVYDGVNDIGSTGSSFATLKAAYDDLISRAHAKGLLIFGATILPFNGNSYYTTAHESVRQQVNTYIKGGAFDGTIDFDAALSDGGNPPKLQAAYAAWSQQDWLHPGPAGYKKMGDSVDLTLFTK